METKEKSLSQRLTDMWAEQQVNDLLWMFKKIDKADEEFLHILETRIYLRREMIKEEEGKV